MNFVLAVVKWSGKRSSSGVLCIKVAATFEEVWKLFGARRYASIFSKPALQDSVSFWMFLLED